MLQWMYYRLRYGRYLKNPNGLRRFGEKCLEDAATRFKKKLAGFAPLGFVVLPGLASKKTALLERWAFLAERKAKVSSSGINLDCPSRWDKRSSSGGAGP